MQLPIGHNQDMMLQALVVSGWYDDNSMGTTEALDVIKDYEKEEL